LARIGQPEKEISEGEQWAHGKRAAATGMAWMFVNTALGRAVVLLSQLALGWILTPRDFGAYAIALSIFTAVSAIRNGGVMQILIYKGERYNELAGPLLKYAMVFNILGMAILLLCSVFVTRIFQSSQIAFILTCAAFAFVLGTPGAIFRAKLTIERRFGAISVISVTSILVWQMPVVVLALHGYGASSFAVPLVIQALYESVVGWFYVKSEARIKGLLDWKKIREFWHETKWIMLSSAALALATSGDYFVLGLLTEPETVGVYFFAFQLAVAIGLLFNNGIEAVFPSVLTQLNRDQARQMAAFVKVIRAIALVSMPVAMAFSILAPAALHLIWQGKWDVAIPCTQILAACIPAWLIVNTGRTFLEARGLWRPRFGMLAIYGLGAIGSVAVGAMMGTVGAVAIAVSCYYLVFASCFLWYLIKTLELPHAELLIAVCGAAAVTIVSAIASLWLAQAVVREAYISSIVSSGIFLLLAILLNTVFFRHAWREVASVFMSRKIR
jgi:O-antigen/teichoic acid export membrane protein